MIDLKTLSEHCINDIRQVSSVCMHKGRKHTSLGHTSNIKLLTTQLPGAND